MSTMKINFEFECMSDVSMDGDEFENIEEYCDKEMDELKLESLL